MASKFKLLVEFIELEEFAAEIDRIGDPDLLEHIQSELSKNPTLEAL